MPRGLSTPVVIVTFLIIFASRFYAPLKTKYIVAGFSRPRDQIVNIHGDQLVKIPNTSHCEDLHYHEPSNKLITACQNTKVKNARRGWFPPLGLFDVKHSKVQGSLVVIDPTVRHEPWQSYRSRLTEIPNRTSRQRNWNSNNSKAPSSHTALTSSTRPDSQISYTSSQSTISRIPTPASQHRSNKRHLKSRYSRTL